MFTSYGNQSIDFPDLVSICILGELLVFWCFQEAYNGKSVWNELKSFPVFWWASCEHWLEIDYHKYLKTLLPGVPFSYPLKTLENQKFSDAFKGLKKVTPTIEFNRFD